MPQHMRMQEERHPGALAEPPDGVVISIVYVKPIGSGQTSDFLEGPNRELENKKKGVPPPFGFGPMRFTAILLNARLLAVPSFDQSRWRCAARCQSRCREIWPASRYPHP